jgi:7-cyano-7-deazaguanine synthase in queuosine biosynthesis
MLKIHKKITLNLPAFTNNIIVSMSGGSDSTLLTYLIAKHLKDSKIKKTITPLIFLPKNHTNHFLNKKSDDILKQITKLTKFKFCKKIIKYLKHKFELSSNDFNSFKQTDFIVLGATKNPNVKFKDNENRDKKRDNEKYMIDNDGTKIDKKFIPLYHLNKKDIALIYKENNLLKTLLPYTYSCINENQEQTNQYKKPCKKCWWCEEKNWAFGVY